MALVFYDVIRTATNLMTYGPTDVAGGGNGLGFTT